MIHQLIARCINDAHLFNQQGRFHDAVARCQQVLKISSEVPEAWFNLGLAHSGLGDRRAALRAFEEVRRRTPDSAPAQCDIGLQLLALDALAEAAKCLERAQAIAPNEALVQINLGLLRQKQGRLDDALQAFKNTVELRPDIALAHANLGGVFNLKKEFALAEQHCRKAVELDATLAAGWSNLGDALNGQLKHEAAEAACREAVRQAPGMVEAWITLSKALIGREQFFEAGAACARATELDPSAVEAWMNMGISLRKLKNFEKAAQAFSNALTLKPDLDFVLAEVIDAQRSDCAWDSLVEKFSLLRTKVEKGNYGTHHFAFLSFTDDLALIRKAMDFNATRFPANTALGPVAPRPVPARIRVGYFSADFRPHPVAYLISELFELHDRDRFEIIGFSFGPRSNDPYRCRIQAAFDRFFDVRDQSHLEIAQLARALEIDIAIDLMGFTEHCRSEIFALRAAPIQASYLGYPGTSCLPYIDYLIADPTLIPEESRQYYSERIAYLPDSYQPNDRKRRIAERTFTRSEQGLPDSAFIFCCVNNTYKLSPDTFAVWMSILRQTGNSVLWLTRPSATAVENLKKEAVRHGVAPERIVFASQMPELADHLARLRLADLFLDTLPFNAHTTASDALWAGVPVLTCMGEALQSRVAASLLNAIGLPELVTTNMQDYERLALELAGNPEKLAALRNRLAQNRDTTPLFDTPKLTRHLESAYEQMMSRYQAGLPPDHIFVERS